MSTGAWKHTDDVQVYAGRMALVMAVLLSGHPSLYLQAHLSADMNTFTVRWRS